MTDSREVETGARQMATQCLQSGRKEEAQAWHHTAETIASQRQRIERLEAALRPFAEYAVDQLDNQLPQAIAADDATPVWGDEWSGQRQIVVGDLKRARQTLEES